jgi:hypothetical protein
MKGATNRDRRMNPNADVQPLPSAQPLARHPIVDAQHQGMTVATFEHPPGWQAQSRVVWNFQHTSLPVWVHAATYNPGGTEALEFLPVEAFYWLEPNYGFDAPGQSKYGMTCMPPMSAADAMTRLVVPKYRGACQNLRVVGVQPVPDLPQALGDPALLQSPSESVGVRIEYQANGQAFEEEFYGVKTQNQAAGGMSVQINWGFARLFCFRAARGHLEAARPTLWQIARSTRPNPQWQALDAQVVQQLNAQHGAMIDGWRAKLQGEAQFQEQLKGYYQEQRDRQSAGVARGIEQDRLRRQEADAALSGQERWRNELGGVTAYHDPNSAEGNVLYHPSGDVAVFMNERGEVVGSQDPTFDPSIGSTHTWQRLRGA